MKDELTRRDIYMYNRGKLAEYIRSHPCTTAEEYRRLMEWIKLGNDIHSNPFGFYDETGGRPYDYLDAIRIAESTK